MKEAFKDSFERELALLKERAALFAQSHPGSSRQYVPLSFTLILNLKN